MSMPTFDSCWHEQLAVGTIEGVNVVIVVRSNPTVGDVLALVERDSAGAHKVLVADQLLGIRLLRPAGQGHQLLRWPRSSPPVAPIPTHRLARAKRTCRLQAVSVAAG
jgi:hypothetical protein